jgi:hypothetical protein
MLMQLISDLVKPEQKKCSIITGGPERLRHGQQPRF